MDPYGFDSPDLFGPGPRPQLEWFAAETAETLRESRRHVEDAAMLAQLDVALRSRSLVDQALGIIMADRRCTSAVAFELLRHEAHNNHCGLHDVAVDVVTRTTAQHGGRTGWSAFPQGARGLVEVTDLRP